MLLDLCPNTCQVMIVLLLSILLSTGHGKESCGVRLPGRVTKVRAAWSHAASLRFTRLPSLGCAQCQQDPVDLMVILERQAEPLALHADAEQQLEECADPDDIQLGADRRGHSQELGHRGGGPQSS